MTRDILPIIVKQCEKIGPIIYFDDVFLGQIVKISNISLVSFPYYKVQYYPKAYSGSEYAKIWAIHRYTPADNLALWQMANLSLVCCKQGILTSLSFRSLSDPSRHLHV